MSSLILAFSMYSRLPMPRSDWDEKSMRHVMCFFPLIGAVIGACELLWFYLAEKWTIGSLLRSCLAAALPLLITGGIHLDGFLDVMDAKSSWSEPEKRLAILRDPHIGAFSVVGGLLLLLLTVGLLSELTGAGLPLFALSFFYSRCLSGFSVVTLKKARSDGLTVHFSRQADTLFCQRVLLAQLLASSLLLLLLQPVWGSVSILTGLFSFFCYRRLAYRDFGGITGDLAGYFLQRCELLLLLVAVLAGRLS